MSDGDTDDDLCSVMSCDDASTVTTARRTPRSSTALPRSTRASLGRNALPLRRVRAAPRAFHPPEVVSDHEVCETDEDAPQLPSARGVVSQHVYQAALSRQRSLEQSLGAANRELRNNTTHVAELNATIALLQQQLRQRDAMVAKRDEAIRRMQSREDALAQRELELQSREAACDAVLRQARKPRRVKDADVDQGRHARCKDEDALPSLPRIAGATDSRQQPTM